MQINIKNLMNDNQCYETVRKMRWPNDIECPFCNSKHIIKRPFNLFNFVSNSERNC